MACCPIQKLEVPLCISPTSCINSRGRFHFTPPVPHIQPTIPTCAYLEALKGKTGWSVLLDSHRHILARTYPRPLETHAGQLLGAHTPSIGVNMHHMTLAWRRSSCKHVEMTQKPRRVQALTPVHKKQGLVHNRTLRNSFFPRGSWLLSAEKPNLL